MLLIDSINSSASLFQGKEKTKKVVGTLEPCSHGRGIKPWVLDLVLTPSVAPWPWRHFNLHGPSFVLCKNKNDTDSTRVIGL